MGSPLWSSAGGVGVEGLLFVWVDGDKTFFRKRRIVDVRIQRLSILFSVWRVLTHRLQVESHQSLGGRTLNLSWNPASSSELAF